MESLRTRNARMLAHILCTEGRAHARAVYHKFDVKSPRQRSDMMNGSLTRDDGILLLGQQRGPTMSWNAMLRSCNTASGRGR